MKNILEQVIINNNIIGFSIVLVILGKALKNSPKIPNYMILWILMFVSMILSLLTQMSVPSLIEGFIAVSLANTYHQTYKQTKAFIRGVSSA